MTGDHCYCGLHHSVLFHLFWLSTLKTPQIKTLLPMAQDVKCQVWAEARNFLEFQSFSTQTLMLHFSPPDRKKVFIFQKHIVLFSLWWTKTNTFNDQYTAFILVCLLKLSFLHKMKQHKGSSQSDMWSTVFEKLFASYLFDEKRPWLFGLTCISLTICSGFETYSPEGKIYKQNNKKNTTLVLCPWSLNKDVFCSSAPRTQVLQLCYCYQLVLERGEQWMKKRFNVKVCYFTQSCCHWYHHW